MLKHRLRFALCALLRSLSSSHPKASTLPHGVVAVEGMRMRYLLGAAGGPGRWIGTTQERSDEMAVSGETWVKVVMMALMVGAFGCSEEPGEDGPADVGVDVDAGDVDPIVDGRQMRFAVGSDAYFDLPFPSDVRSQEGFEDVFSSWPGADRRNILRAWFDAADTRLQGWGLIGGMFAHFDGALNAETLVSDPNASLSFEEGAPSAFLVDVDPQSPEQGNVLPIECE